jgi:hypothetical protein
MTFRDGPGEYKLEVVNAEGKHLRTMFDRRIIAEKDAWAAWDGIDEEGKLMSVGLYYAVFIKDGRLLKKIVLSWVPGKS